MNSPLSDLERAVLSRRALVLEPAAPESPASEFAGGLLPPGQKERYLALLALARGDEQTAGTGFRRSSMLFEVGSREWAVSERFYGLVLIRLGREVEGTFVLERADFVLDSLDLERFDLAEL